MYAASLALTKGTRLFEVSEIRVDITRQQFEQCLHRERESSRMSPNILDKLKHLGAYIFPLIKIHQCCKYEPHSITCDAATRRPSNWKHPKWPPRAEDSKPNQRSLCHFACFLSVFTSRSRPVRPACLRASLTDVSKENVTYAYF